MERFVDWILDVAIDVLAGLAIYGLLRLVETRRGMEWAEIFQFIRGRASTRYPQPRWSP